MFLGYSKVMFTFTDWTSDILQNRYVNIDILHIKAQSQESFIALVTRLQNEESNFCYPDGSWIILRRP